MIFILKKLYRYFILKKVPRKIKNNFKKLTKQYMTQIEEILLENYFNNAKEITKDDLEDHIKNRIFVSRTKVIPWIMKNLELKNKKVLEVGCGTGSSSITMAEQGAEVTGIDVDIQSIKVARLRANLLDLKIEFLKFSGTQINKLNQIIDYIDNGDLATAKDTATQLRDELQEDVDKAESDIDIQLNLENESKYGK